MKGNEKITDVNNFLLNAMGVNKCNVIQPNNVGY